MEEEEDISSPFWVQNSSTNRRRLSHTYSLFISSGTVVIFLLVITLAFILVIVPTLHSFYSHIFKPNSVKKSWDTLNILLVLFAIFCGFLSKKDNNNESPRSYEDQTFSERNTRQEYEKLNPKQEIETETPPRFWYEYSEDRTSYNRLRSFNSYPDLRQESLWVAGDERWRFSDDTHVNGYRGLDSNFKEEKEEASTKNIEVGTTLKGKNKKKQALEHGLDLNFKQEKEEASTKDIEVDTSLKGKNKKKQALERGLDLNFKEEKEASTKNIEVDTSWKGKNKKKQAIEKHESETIEKVKNNKDAERKNKKASSTKDDKMYRSLKGKKKQRHRSAENFQSFLNSEPPTRMPSSSSFHDLFTLKKNKEKKLKSVSPPQHHVSSMLVSKTKDEDFFVITGNESPLNSIPPPPPPPPPFKMPAWKFKVQGDFVRIDSISSTSDGLADIDDDDDEVMELPTSLGEEPGIDLLVYPNPNPDVDSKAGSFIQSFRAGLKMEKMNSIKKQGIGRSNLYNTLHHQNH
ncbi:hydroxyproline-rich glycoprotein family protein [Trifolium repens]|nr:hydroxyproline-rich glycoprotein family protein [Trifolium repens]